MSKYSKFDDEKMVEGPLKCPQCMGAGRVDGKQCAACHGSGRFDPSSLSKDSEDPLEGGYIKRTEPCPDCHGKKTGGKKPCMTCGGSGVLTVRQHGMGAILDEELPGKRKGR